MHTVQLLCLLCQMKASRAAKFSAYEKSCVLLTLRVAIPKFTTTCFILQFALPTRHIVANTKRLFWRRWTICFRRRTRMSRSCSNARVSRSEHRKVGRSRRDWWTTTSVSRLATRRMQKKICHEGESGSDCRSLQGTHARQSSHHCSINLSHGCASWEGFVTRSNLNAPFRKFPPARVPVL